eukprot:15329747-Alexandrium_andersonii.AAC.1
MLMSEVHRMALAAASFADELSRARVAACDARFQGLAMEQRLALEAHAAAVRQRPVAQTLDE